MVYDVSRQRKLGEIVGVFDTVPDGFAAAVEERQRERRQTAHVLETNLTMSPDAADDRKQVAAFKVAEGDAEILAVDDVGESSFVEVEDEFHDGRRLIERHFVRARRLRRRS